MPKGAVIFVSVLVACYMADRMKDKTLWAAISATIGMIFGALCFGLQHKSSAGALAAFSVRCDQKASKVTLHADLLPSCLA